MPLYLDEIYFNISSKEEYKQVCERMTNNMSKGFPPGVTLKAGPWFSNEEPKVILILDIQDHSMTFTPFSNGQRVEQRGDCKAAPHADRRLGHSRENRQGFMMSGLAAGLKWCGRRRERIHSALSRRKKTPSFPHGEMEERFQSSRSPSMSLKGLPCLLQENR